MKVLFIYKGKSKEGANRVVVTQGKSLEKRGVEIDYFPLSGRGPGVYLSALPAIRRRLKSGGADLLHAHYAISGIAGLLGAGRKPLVVSFMGSDILGSHSVRGKLKLWSKLMIYVHKFLARYFYSFTIVKSEQMGGKLLKNTKFAVIPNGVDISLFKPLNKLLARQKLNLGMDETIVLFPADRRNTEKNFALASAAVEMIKDGKFRLLDVNNAGRDEMNLLFNAADLLLVTSFHEGSPNIVKEAMATGCPVVSSAVGDIQWLFGNMPGHYLSGFDAGELAGKIREAAEFRKEHEFTDGRDRIMKLGLDTEHAADLIISQYVRLSVM